MLGQGVFGQTYLVEDQRLSERVVLKVSQAPSAERSRAEKLFRREAEVRHRIIHPNVAVLRDLGELPDGRPYLVSEWVNGPTVRELLKDRGRLPLDAALAVASAVASALQAAHSVGVIHRDIKPENVIVPEDDQGVRFESAKLVDFGGLGELLQDSNATLPGQVFGTPTYMSPEQLRGQPQTPAADIYGFAMLLYEMLYGKPAFVADSIPAFVHMALEQPVEFPGLPEVPEMVTALIAKCLSKKAEARPASAREVIAQLETLRTRGTDVPIQYVPNPPALVLKAGEDTEHQHPARPARAMAPPLPALAGHESPSCSAPRETISPPGRASLAASSRPAFLLAIGLTITLLGLGIYLTWFGNHPHLPREATGLLLGILLIMGGIALGVALHRWLGRRRSQIEGDAQQILQGARARRTLTESIALEVDELFRRCNQLDERILAASIGLMLQEYGAAKKSDDRQKALMNVIQITDKLTDRLCPWYVKHEKVIAFLGSAVGVISGAASAAESFVKILGKH